MLSIGKLGAGQESYYLEAVADGAEDYYVHAGEAPGQWLGGGAGDLGLEGLVDGSDFTALLRGRRPGTTDRLGRDTKVPGFDLTFSAPKSVSVLFAIGEPDLADRMRAAHDAAVRDAVAYLEGVAAHGRRGHAGALRIRSSGFVGAAFRHRTSRAGDPHLHTHVVVANRVRGVDGAWSALDARALYVQAKTAGTLYGASLRHQLRDLGLTWTVAPTGLAELDAVPREVLRAFSARRREIEAALDDRGLTSARAAQAATLQSRRSKEVGVDDDSLRGRWVEQAGALGLTGSAVRALLARGRTRLAHGNPREPSVPQVGELTEKASTFGERDVLRAVARSLPDGAPVADVLRRTRAALEGPGVVPLDQRERALRGEPVLRRQGRRGLVPLGASEQRWSTTDLLLLEQRVVQAAVDGQGSAQPGRPAAVDEALQARPHLNDEQGELVRRLVLQPDTVQVVSAAAGSGKTTALGAAATAWRASGLPVVGVTLAAKAALVLHEETGVPAFTLARALLDLGDERGTPLAPRTVLLVDEAGQVGTRALAELLAHVQRAGGKLVLVGDPHQLPEIDAGGAYRGLLNRLPVLALETNHRQANPDEQARLAELRKGDVLAALASYDAAGRIVRGDDGDQMKQRLVGEWAQAALPVWREREGQVVMIGLTNRDVDDLNAIARRLLQEHGLVDRDGIVVGESEFSVGDQVVTRHNDRILGVLNGERWTVAATSLAGVVLQQGDRTVTLPSTYEDLQHAYALTTAVSQGSTVDRAFVLGSDATYREAGYTAASRARHGTTFYVVAEERAEAPCGHSQVLNADQPEPLAEFAAALQRSAAEPMALDAAPGSSPDYQPMVFQSSRQDELDLLRERLSDAPPDLRRKVARAHRELTNADVMSQQAATSQGSAAARAARWSERTDQLRVELTELEAQQQLRTEWESVNEEHLRRMDALEDELREGAPNRAAELAVDL